MVSWCEDEPRFVRVSAGESTETTLAAELGTDDQVLLHAGRADFIAPADFRDGSKLARRVELLLDAIIAGIAYRREAFRCLQENRAGA